MVSTLKLVFLLQVIAFGVSARQLKQYDNSPSPDPWEPGAPRYYCVDIAYAMTQPPYNYPYTCYQDPGCTQMGIDLSTLQSSCNGGCTQMCNTALSGLSIACRYELVTWQDQWGDWLASQTGMAPLGYNPWSVGFSQCGLPYSGQDTVTPPDTPTTTIPTTMPNIPSTTISPTIPTNPTVPTTNPTQFPTRPPGLVNAAMDVRASGLVLLATLAAGIMAL